MEIFNTHFVNTVVSELNALPFGGSITREKLCIKIEIDPVNMPVISLLLLTPEFSAFESAKKAGIRRKKYSSPVVCIGAVPVTVPHDEPLPVTEPEPTPELESAPQAEPEDIEPNTGSVAPRPVADLEPDFNGPVIAVSSKPVLKIVGTDGNAFALMGQASRVARKNGMDWDTILDDLTSGDYDTLLATLCKYFDVQ